MRVETRVVRAWLAVALWALLIWTLGGDGFASSDTSRIIGPLLDWLLPDADQATRADLLFAIRKTAHVVEYGVLGLLAVRALWLASRFSNARSIALSLVLVASLAIADETRQGRSATRSGSEWDVLLDVGGALLALLLVFALPARWRVPLFPRSPEAPG